MRLRQRLPGATLVLLCVLAPAGGPAAQATVRIETRNGERIILNESNDNKQRRRAIHFVDLPDGSLLPRIEQHARTAGLDPRLVRAVIQVESGYNPQALSNKGAMGLMQLMPETARMFAVSDPYDPDQNIRAGTSYLRRLLDSFQGRLEHALAGYNAGPNAVARYRGVPPYRETKDYLERVLGLYQGRDAGAIGRRVFVTKDPTRGIVITTEPHSPR
jgi:soluble lytic murein transglycosylase-like protein